MKKLTVEHYHEQQDNCDNLCNITDEVVADNDLMRCVTCPFCKEVVNATLTAKTIACPECGVVVSR
jgi:predicted RNA-binding Zn-ribbon protein involved in translation (DUF1610 family)